MSKGRKLAAESRREAVNRAYSKRPQPELGTCWLNEIGHGGKHEKSDRCSEWRAAPQPEPTPLGRCCESGMFGEPHECRKQPSPAGAPQMQITELQHIAWVIVHSGFEPEARLGGCCCDICSLLREQMEAIRKREAEEYVEALHKVIDYASPAGAREFTKDFFSTRMRNFREGSELPYLVAMELMEAYAKKERERADAFRDTSSPPAGAREAHLFSSFHACENEGANCISFIQAIGGQKGHVCWCECHEWNKHA